MVNVSNGDFPWADRMRQMVTNLFSKHLLNASKSGLVDFLVNKTKQCVSLHGYCKGKIKPTKGAEGNHREGGGKERKVSSK